MKKDSNENLELLIELTEGMAQEEGFKTLRMSSDDKSMTSEDGGLNWHRTNYIKA